MQKKSYNERDVKEGDAVKIARFFSILLGILASALMVLSIGLCLVSLNRQPQLQEVPEQAQKCAQTLMDNICTGDFQAAAQVMYGQPDLGADRDPADTAGVMIWDAFLGSISWEWKSGYYLTDTGIGRDARITFLEIPSVTEAIGRRSHELLTAKVVSATDMAELYDESNNFRPELVEAVLQEAVVRALAEDAKQTFLDVKLTMIHRDGKWWAVPDQALLTALSGGVA